MFNKGEGGWGTVYAGWIHRIIITKYCLYISYILVESINTMHCILISLFS